MNPFEATAFSNDVILKFTQSIASHIKAFIENIEILCLKLPVEFYRYKQSK